MNGYFYNLGAVLSSVLGNFPNEDAIRYFDHNYSFSEICSITIEWVDFLKSKGVSINHPIGIKSDKSINSYCSVLACNLLGVAYAHFDPHSPVEREDFILDTLNPTLMLNFVDGTLTIFSNKITEELPDNSHKTFHSVTFIENKIASLCEYIHGETTAYIMFTSGSTGKPKGVAISQSSLINFICWVRATYGVGYGDAFSGLNQSHFDNSVFDLYGSIYNGASLIPITSKELKFPTKVLAKLNQLKATIWFSVPSYLTYCLKLKTFIPERTALIRAIIFGGEGFPKGNLKKLRASVAENTNLYNVYGPTEATCICSSHKITEKDLQDSSTLAPLGKLAPNFGFKIENKNEDGVGELVLLGPQIAQGYVANQKLTNQKFTFVNELGLFEKAYYTGDLVRLNNGMLHFMGRTDNQIKHMGYRIELEEIESYFHASPFIIECIVIHKLTVNDLSRLELHIVCDTNVNEIDIIIEDILRKLPAYMRPHEIHFHEELPKNANGKIDRKRLLDEP